jgi:hypothetical protein
LDKKAGDISLYLSRDVVRSETADVSADVLFRLNSDAADVSTSLGPQATDIAGEYSLSRDEYDAQRAGDLLKAFHVFSPGE